MVWGTQEGGRRALPDSSAARRAAPHSATTTASPHSLTPGVFRLTDHFASVTLEKKVFQCVMDV
ncbi:hypothetical protein E2C01_028030 [Portunus trituberculatus]|uniref:Uncharacterized protein n=1 Tax=Portunus trituberculatus TaxID=210409 RepID=A0A5B7EQI5_PORTR|nr:hypothetical protein [Portunus trituberculatus]